MAAVADPLDTLYANIPGNTTVVVGFKHGGHPFRIQFTKTDHWGARMTAYSGDSGEMNSRNRIERKYVSGYNRTLRQCIEIGAKRAFEIEPIDLSVTITPDN